MIEGVIGRLRGARWKAPREALRAFVVDVDGVTASSSQALEAAAEGQRLGRLVIEYPGGRAHYYPPTHLPAGRVTFRADGSIVVVYLPGYRGAVAETGARADPITVDRWHTLRRHRRQLPDLQSMAEIGAFLGELEEIG
jgi:hypothetical protein